MLNYQTWLENSNTVRILLVQANVLIGTTETTKYLSTHTATVGGIEYQAIIKNSISVNESIDLNYRASISFGDIELANNSGELDSWLDYVWKNRSVKIYYGPLVNAGNLDDDFELVFDGICEDIDAKSRQSLNLKIRDKLEKLNTPVSEELIGNYFKGSIVTETVTVNQNRNLLKPRVYGEVHNISPVLTDPTELEFMVSDGPVEQIIEVLDNGVPVSFITVAQSGTSAIPAGSFRLLAPLQGTCTASVQGIARTVNVAGETYTDAYNPSISNTILNLLKFSGKTLDYTEIDNESFEKLGKESCGVYLNSRTNVLAVCQELAKSAGLTLVVSRLGKVKLVKIETPRTEPIDVYVASGQSATDLVYLSWPVLTSTSGYLGEPGITYSLSGVDAGKFNISANGDVRFKATPSHASPLDYNGDNIYEIKVVKTSVDGSVSYTKVAIGVLDFPPAVRAGSVVTVKSGFPQGLYLRDVSASNISGYPDVNITYGFEGGADDSLFKIDPRGRISFKNVPDYANPVDADSNNRYELRLYAQDPAGNRSFLTTTVVVDSNPSTLPNYLDTPVLEDSMLLNTLRITSKLDVVGAVKLGYAKNYTVLTGLVTGIPEEHKDLFSKEYLEVLLQDPEVTTRYELGTEPVLETSLLINETDALIVAEEKLNLFKVQRSIFTFSCTSKYLNLELGTKVLVYSTRFGMSVGKPGVVISTKPNWITGKIELEVLI